MTGAPPIYDEACGVEVGMLVCEIIGEACLDMALGSAATPSTGFGVSAIGAGPVGAVATTGLTECSAADSPATSAAEDSAVFASPSTCFGGSRVGATRLIGFGTEFVSDFCV